jgi:hypothetical protein
MPSQRAVGGKVTDGTELAEADGTSRQEAIRRAVIQERDRGLLATATLLRVSGRPFRLTQSEAFDLITGVAEGTLDVPVIAARLHRGGE